MTPLLVRVYLNLYSITFAPGRAHALLPQKKVLDKLEDFQGRTAKVIMS